MGTKRKGLTGWPEGWEMTLVGAAYARARNLDPERTWEEFKDYHLRHGSQFADWDAALRTWCRKAVEIKAEKAERKAIGFTRPVTQAVVRDGLVGVIANQLGLPANVRAAMQEQAEARAAVEGMDDGQRQAARLKFSEMIRKVVK